MKKYFLFLSFVFLSSNTLAENIEKLIKGKPIIQDWSETETLSCSKWTPNPSHYTIGKTFEQKSHCLVRQERYTQEVFIGAITHEIKEKGEKIVESITVNKIKTRTEYGTFNPEYQLTVGTYYKEGKRYFGYINSDVREAYKIGVTDDSSIESEGLLSKTEYRGYELAALFQNDTHFILVYDKKAKDEIKPIIKINNKTCNVTEAYLNNGAWDIFYFTDCVDLSTSEKYTISLTIN